MASTDSVGEEDIESLKQQLVAEREARAAAEARAAEAAARATSAEALIAHLRLAIEKLKRDLYGSRSEHGRKLIEQMELQLEELVANAAEDSAKAELAPKGETIISTHVRRHPVRKPLPAAPAARAGDRARSDRLPPAVARPSSPSSARTSLRRWR
jgi:transposase